MPGSGSQASITIYDHAYERLFVRAVFVSAQTYILNWSVEDSDGWGYASEGVALHAYSNGVQLANGRSYPAFASVDFVLTLPAGLEPVSWTDNVTVDPDDNARASIERLEADTTVRATLRKKAAVIVSFQVKDTGDGTHGTLTAAVDEATLENGESVFCGDTVIFTASPENGYRAQAWEDVAYVYANELMTGTSATTFSPNVTTTRGMFVTILYRLEGEPAVSDNCPFNDVKSGSYYEKAITWAAANGIVSGYGNGRFGPDAPITREQMAVILYCYTQFKKLDVSAGEDADILSYKDVQKISEYAFSAMQWICGESSLNGSDGNLMS